MDYGQFSLNPGKFYAAVDLVESHRTLGKNVTAVVESVVESLGESAQKAEQDGTALARATNAMMQEWRMTSRKRNPTSKTEVEDILDEFRHSADGQNFLRVAFDTSVIVQRAYSAILEVAHCLRPQELLLPKDRKSDFDLDSIHKLHSAIQINSDPVKRYVAALVTVEALEAMVADYSDGIFKVMEGYHKALNRRHTLDGVQVFGDAVLTDVAMHIFENVDSDGEISAGKGKDELSAYSVRKARTMAEALAEPFVRGLIFDGGLVASLIGHLNVLQTAAKKLRSALQDQTKKAKEVAGVRISQAWDAEFRIRTVVQALKDLDPQAIQHKEKSGLLSQAERFQLKFKNETLEKIVALLQDNEDPADLVGYVLERKEELRKYFQEQNSFYVCTIGSGNPFTHEAPGGLEVVPGAKPVAAFSDIVGSGFTELKEFIRTVKSASRWQDLFMATSPNKTADKSNVLLIGPQGCGKSEAMRAIASEKDSIAIFAVGSDFLTCWRGEAQKNPKRLFEAALKIQRESKKHVHILLDEVDAVLKKKELVRHGDDDLTTEFQNMMDGVVHYPNISVWGATNHPDRIPMPMIRRFSKVLVVGELSSKDRSDLLKQFLSVLPTSGFQDRDWEAAASRLHGAVGDVVRKVTDHVWRTKMHAFTESRPEEAGEIVEWLNSRGRFTVEELDAAPGGGKGDTVRQLLKERLKDWISVTPEDLSASISLHLDSVAIRSEIRAAIETYERARELMADLSTGLVAAS